MTYKTRQEVLRAAADWMDICEKAGVKANCKWDGEIGYLKNRGLHDDPAKYEFPIALLEGKEVWVGSELWCGISNHKFTVKGLCNNGSAFEYATVYDGRVCVSKDSVSWNPLKPNTVMVEMLVEDAEWLASFGENEQASSAGKSCKKALENLK